MRASVKRNHFVGTTAADIPSGSNLPAYFKEKGIDTDKYDPIGTRFHGSYRGGLLVNVFCLDIEKSTKEAPYIVEIELKQPIRYYEYFNLFRRFEGIFIEGCFEQFKVADFIKSKEDEQWQIP